MADSNDDIDLGAIVDLVTNQQRDDFAFHYRVTRDMGQTAADAARDVAKLQFAVPARNRTYRVAIGATATVVVCWLAVQKLDGDGLSKVLVAAVAAIGAVFVVREYKKKKAD